jgi:hypothetical protein
MNQSEKAAVLDCPQRQSRTATTSTCDHDLRNVYLNIRDGIAVKIEDQFGRYSEEGQEIIRIQHALIELMHRTYNR